MFSKSRADEKKASASSSIARGRPVDRNTNLPSGTVRRSLSIFSRNSGFEADGASKQVPKEVSQGPIESDDVIMLPSACTVTKAAAASKIGMIPLPVEKVNQDSHFELSKFNSDITQHFFGVADGHGVVGHLVSDLIRRKLPIYLSREPSLKSNPREALAKSFGKMNEDVCSSGIEVSFSGSTCVTCFLRGSLLFSANVGDSRAILGKRIGGGSAWEAVALSNDHKPDIPKEKDRIVSQRGRVEAYKLPTGEYLGPARVWLRDQDVPGLGMSRSFGDTIAASVGVISEPEIQTFQLTREDKFIVIGSDGLFEFFPNDEIVKFVVPFLAKDDPRGAASELVKEAQLRWRRSEDVIDDTTAVVVFLNVP